MGTNYYFHQKSTSMCEHCGHDPGAKVLHIGKSSYGWCFSLHIIPEEGINSLDDWKLAWDKPDAKILNEYDEVVRPEDMLKIITLVALENGHLRELNHGDMMGITVLGMDPKVMILSSGSLVDV